MIMKVVEFFLNLFDDFLIKILKKCILPKGTPTRYQMRGVAQHVLNPRMDPKYVYPDGASLASFHFRYATIPGHKDPYEHLNITI